MNRKSSTSFRIGWTPTILMWRQTTITPRRIPTVTTVGWTHGHCHHGNRYGCRSWAVSTSDPRYHPRIEFIWFPHFVFVADIVIVIRNKLIKEDLIFSSPCINGLTLSGHSSIVIGSRILSRWGFSSAFFSYAVRCAPPEVQAEQAWSTNETLA